MGDDRSCYVGVLATASKTTGQRVKAYTYDAYGNIGTEQGASQPFRYTGRRYDAETGLYYYRARYYSATLGRFMQTDPIGYEDNMNLYGYTANDPVNFVDPFGLESQGLPEVVTSCPDDGPIVCAFFGDDDDDDEGSSFDGLFDFSKFFDLFGERAKAEIPRIAAETAEIAEGVAITTLECAARETGLDTLAASVIAASGANVIPTRGKFAGSTPGTSPASLAARNLAGNTKFPGGVRVLAPTLNAPLATTAKIGTAGGRLVPLLGQALLAKDAFNTVGCVADGGVSNGE